MNLDQIIQNRRNINPKFFSGESVADDVVKKIIRSANWAPTHGSTEPWRFVVFSGHSRQEFAFFQSELYKSISADNFNHKKYMKLLKTPQLASHIIAIIVAKSINTRISLLEEIVSCSCAVQNMLLSAYEKNVSVHWTTGGVTYEDKMKSFLGFHSNDQVLGFLYLGKSDLSKYKGIRLSSAESKTQWK
jgi:nitroreductase